GPQRPPYPARPACPTTPAAAWTLAGDHAGGWLLAGGRAHVGGLGAFLALGDVELDGLAVGQRGPVLDGADMHEHVVAGLRLDEAIATVGVEPLHSSNTHGDCPSPRWLAGLDRPRHAP